MTKATNKKVQQIWAELSEGAKKEFLNNIEAKKYNQEIKANSVLTLANVDKKIDKLIKSVNSIKNESKGCSYNFSKNEKGDLVVKTVINLAVDVSGSNVGYYINSDSIANKMLRDLIVALNSLIDTTIRRKTLEPMIRGIVSMQRQIEKLNQKGFFTVELDMAGTYVLVVKMTVKKESLVENQKYSKYDVNYLVGDLHSCEYTSKANPCRGAGMLLAIFLNIIDVLKGEEKELYVLCDEDLQLYTRIKRLKTVSISDFYVFAEPEVVEVEEEVVEVAKAAQQAPKVRKAPVKRAATTRKAKPQCEANYVPKNVEFTLLGYYPSNSLKKEYIKIYA